MEWRPFDVTVISAQGIKNVNYFSTMDVYVEVSIVGYAKNTKRTFIDKRGGTSPKWNHPMKFTLDEPSLTKPGLSLYFRLRSDRLFGDKDIGIVSIPINEIFGQSASGPDGSAERIVEYQVFTPISGRPRGTLKFSYKFGKKYGQPSEPMFKNANQPNGMYNENKHGDVPVTAYPYSQTGSNNVPPGKGYGMSNMAYQQPVGYPPTGCDTHFAAKLTELYFELLPVQTARKVFDEIPHPSAATCNRILQRFCGKKRYGEVLSLFSSMLSFQKPDHFTLLFALKACSALKTLNFGKTIHGFGIKHGNIHSNMFLGSALIEFYSKCGDMDDALRVFEEYTKPDLVLWTTLVTGYEQSFKPDEALAVFTGMMMTRGISPDPVTLVTVVSACTQVLNLKAGKSVHGLVIRMGSEIPLPLLNSLLNLYAKTGSIEYAGNLFRMMEEIDVISWSCIISCCAHNGATDRAISLFDEMIHKGVEPNSVCVISALQACEACCNLEKGRQIHELAFQKGLELDILVSTALIDMYMSCCSPKEASMVFDRMLNKDVVSWFALLCGCVQNGMFYKSMQIFCDMTASDIQPDATVMVKILVACSELGITHLTSCLHGHVIRGGFFSNSFVRASLIECYAKCGSLGEAVNVFEGLADDKDIVVWSSMFAGYGIHGQAKESIKLFRRMVRDSSVGPNKVTFLSILAACSHAGLVEEGIEFFNMMLNEYQMMPESKHYAIIVDLLGRTGELDKAICFINQMHSQVGAHVWGALLGACKIHQNAEIGEVAARNLLQLDPVHAGYYILLSNMYAVDGKWDDAAGLRSSIKEKQLKKITGQSVVRL